MRTGAVLAAAGLADELFGRETAPAEPQAPPTWTAVRKEFALAGGWVHLGGLLLASHPARVRRAIERHRRGLDANPVHYLHENQGRLEAAVAREAAGYLGVSPTEIALTDSTTMGLGLLYNGLEPPRRRRGGDDAARLLRHPRGPPPESGRTGAAVRTISLYSRGATASTDEIVSAAAAAISPRTRVLAVTWVHSSTGVKLPLRAIADALRPLNASRPPAERVLLCVDGVHGPRRRERHSAGARLRLLRGRVSQVAVRPARHRPRVGPRRGLGARAADHPVVLGAAGPPAS